MVTAPPISEIARLVIALAVLPFIFRVARQIRMSGTSGPWFAITIGAVYASYLFTIIESFVAEPLFNALQHSSYGVAGVAGLLTAIETRRQVLEERLR